VVSLVFDRAHYDDLVQGAIARAKTSLWIATANVKGMMVEAPVGSVARARGRYLSILDTFDDLVKRGVEIRMLHASSPSRPFREELKRHASLSRLPFEMRQCPRVHIKMIAIDGSLLYLGSANFTGAGLGAKGEGRRNFEMGVLTDDDVLLDTTQARFERIWAGKECGACKLRSVCPRPLDDAPRASGTRLTKRAPSRTKRSLPR
jgi:phosphatidylserine/phosphatidylglycerophosphate/cardiolipin synthase-like enzyme